MTATWSSTPSKGTTTRREFQSLEETFRITPPLVTCILWGQGKNQTNKAFIWLGKLVLGFHWCSFFPSSEVFRLNLEQGKFLNSLQTDAVYVYSFCALCVCLNSQLEKCVARSQLVFTFLFCFFVSFWIVYQGEQCVWHQPCPLLVCHRNVWSKSLVVYFCANVAVWVSDCVHIKHSAETIACSWRDSVPPQELHAPLFSVGKSRVSTDTCKWTLWGFFIIITPKTKTNDILFDFTVGTVYICWPFPYVSFPYLRSSRITSIPLSELVILAVE